jgi:hypothetical protein
MGAHSLDAGPPIPPPVRARVINARAVSRVPDKGLSFSKREPRPDSHWAGSREPSHLLGGRGARTPLRQTRGHAKSSSRNVRHINSPYGIRSWKCRITAVSVLGIEIASASPAAVLNSMMYVPSFFGPKIGSCRSSSFLFVPFLLRFARHWNPCVSRQCLRDRACRHGRRRSGRRPRYAH